MSRLIDADELKDFLIRAGRFLKGQDDKRTAAHAIGKIIEHIDNTPTIDAIPTDWLRGKMKEYESREFDEPGMYFRFVLWAWQKHCDEVSETEVKPKRLKDQVCGNDYEN